jgi:hypothetical protein
LARKIKGSCLSNMTLWDVELTSRM